MNDLFFHDAILSRQPRRPLARRTNQNQIGDEI